MPKLENKREVKVEAESSMSVRDIMLAVVLIAAGAVLKIFSNTIFSFTPLKPNMVIAMYTLAIILLRPKLYEAVIIGFISGIICMFLPGATPYANIVSETVGGLCAAALCLAFLRTETGIFIKVPVITFITTLVSGFTFFAMLKILLAFGLEINVKAITVFMTVIFGTAAVNAVISSVLYPALKSVLGKKANG